MSQSIEKERVNKGVGLFLQLSRQKFDRITALEVADKESLTGHFS